MDNAGAMSKLISRIRLALRRGLARADTWIAAAALFQAGRSAAGDDWALAAIAGLVGVVFLVASGDYAWRKGFVAGKRDGGAPRRS